jgi:hypothetical protein
VQTYVKFDLRRTEGLKRIFVVFPLIPDQQSGKIGFYDEGGPESRTGARCEVSGRDTSRVTVWSVGSPKQSLQCSEPPHSTITIDCNPNLLSY